MYEHISTKLIERIFQILLLQDMGSRSWLFKTVKISWLLMQWKRSKFSNSNSRFILHKLISTLKNHKWSWSETRMLEIESVKLFEKRGLMTTRESRGKKLYWIYKFSTCPSSQAITNYMLEIVDNNDEGGINNNRRRNLSVFTFCVIFQFWVDNTKRTAILCRHSKNSKFIPWNRNLNIV